MHPDKKRRFFLFAIALVTIGYTLPVASLWYRYFQTSTPSPTGAVSWSIAVLPEDRYAPAAHFSYLGGGKPMRGFSVLTHYSSRHLGEVEALGPSLWQRKWRAWVNPRNPSQVVFDKVFPWKKTIYVLILWVLLIYFFFLRYSLEKYGNN